VFGLSLDSENKCWIHDGHTNQVIGFDENLKERCVFNGICFNRRLLDNQNVDLLAQMPPSMLLAETNCTGTKAKDR
jgi:hypothetical protein